MISTSFDVTPQPHLIW